MQATLFVEEPPAPVVKTSPASHRPLPSVDVKGDYHGWRADVGCLIEHWEELHLLFLQSSLHSLASPSEPKEREEILRWLNAPQVRHPEPFSFQACLALYDPRLEAEDVQCLVRRILRRSRG
ncbi:MAG: hypothetical protein IPL99_04775 [Candidatus Competibacteraceae bacterium]|nr:hypothetical protein [Candidatus Competibacteraceae bacterium]